MCGLNHSFFVKTSKNVQVLANQWLTRTDFLYFHDLFALNLMFGMVSDYWTDMSSFSEYYFKISALNLLLKRFNMFMA